MDPVVITMPGPSDREIEELQEKAKINPSFTDEYRNTLLLMLDHWKGTRGCKWVFTIREGEPMDMQLVPASGIDPLHEKLEAMIENA